jgi:hypothetical protein
MSPVPAKRPRDDVAAGAEEDVPTKCAKTKLALELGRPVRFAVIPTPQSKVKLSSILHDVELPLREDPVKQIHDTRACDEAVTEAIRLFKESYLSHLTDRYVYDKEEWTADENTEDRNTEKYQDFRRAFVALLPWVGEKERVPDTSVVGGGYNVVQIRGQDPPTHLDHYNKLVQENEWDDALEAQLDLFRCQGPHARAWDALLALSAAMGSRSEKSWLDQNDCSVDVEEGLKRIGMFKDEDLKRLRRHPQGMKWRRNAIQSIIREISQTRIYGYFAHYLASSGNSFRLGLARGVSGQVPASLLITSQLPLWDALHFHTDDKDSSPFKGAAKGTSHRLEDNPWLKEPGRQFALQEANCDVCEESSAENHLFHKARQPARTLQPDEQLKKLLLSSEPVMLLDVVASLAPRDVARTEGLTKIVKAEIKRVFSEAKSRGQAVLLELGSGEPHALAKKVYLPLGAEYGLRCGYIRWRESGAVPWAREGTWADRGCVCLQMP